MLLKQPLVSEEMGKGVLCWRVMNEARRSSGWPECPAAYPVHGKV